MLHHLLLKQVKKFPKSPGVYRFIGKDRKPLYIGKATNLRQRVQSYFRNDVDPKFSAMLRETSRVSLRRTATVLEATILEANLIKKHWPKYNVRERDNTSFAYIVFTGDAYPRPTIIRQRNLQKLLPTNLGAFGPYQSSTIAKTILRLVRRVFPWCDASQPTTNNRQLTTMAPKGLEVQVKPCFHYQLGLCPGACIGKISPREYRRNIQNLALFLRGEKGRLLTKLKRENPEQAFALQHIQDVALYSQESRIMNYELGFKRIEAYDISHLGGKETYGAMVVAKNGELDHSHYRLFKIKEAPANDDLRALEEVLTRRFRHHEWGSPDLILIDGGRPQIKYLESRIQILGIRAPIVGVSKYVPKSRILHSQFLSDRLVFPARTKKKVRELIQKAKPLLLRLRDEAHRFANKGRKRARK